VKSTLKIDCRIRTLEDTFLKKVKGVSQQSPLPHFPQKLSTGAFHPKSNLTKGFLGQFENPPPFDRLRAPPFSKEEYETNVLLRENPPLEKGVSETK
jgi:hypothetical protein